MTLPDWHAEIIDLHEFFQGWLGGTLPKTDAVYARLVDTMAAEFSIVTPGGVQIPRTTLLEQLRAAHGSRPGWTIWIENAQARYQQGGLTVATYEEWQRQADGNVTGRLSTVVLREQAATPHGLSWVHVHETWLPEAVQRNHVPSSKA